MSLPARERRSPSVPTPFILEAAEDWYQKKSGSGRWCPQVQENVRRYVKRWKPAFGSKPVGELQVLDVELYESERAKTGVAASTLNQERTYLRQFCRWARSHGWLEEDPTMNWEHREEVVRKKYCPLSIREERRLLPKMPRWLARASKFAIATGLREGTIRAVLWRMAELRRVRRGLRVWILTIPGGIMKTRKDFWIPLSEEAQEAMGKAKRPEDHIFDLPTKTMVCYYFKRAVRAAGLDPACSFHDTRRTFVARLSAAGVPMNVIMRLGGWKRPTTMLTHYCELQEDVALAAARKVYRGLL